jgi:magnesium-transporting ATPase (P-type)
MVTGDNIYTAKAIAVECGILQTEEPTEQYASIEGRDFRNKSEDERLEIVDKICVSMQVAISCLPFYTKKKSTPTTASCKT